jgi:hypothetical protein
MINFRRDKLFTHLSKGDPDEHFDQHNRRYRNRRSHRHHHRITEKINSQEA